MIDSDLVLTWILLRTKRFYKKIGDKTWQDSSIFQCVQTLPYWFIWKIIVKYSNVVHLVFTVFFNKNNILRPRFLNFSQNEEKQCFANFLFSILLLFSLKWKIITEHIKYINRIKASCCLKQIVWEQDQLCPLSYQNFFSTCSTLSSPFSRGVDRRCPYLFWHKN